MKWAVFVAWVVVGTACSATPRRPLASYLPATVDGAPRTLVENTAPPRGEPDVAATYRGSTFEVEISIYVTHAGLGLRAMYGLRPGEQTQMGSSILRGYAVDGFVVELNLGSFEVPLGATAVPDIGGFARANVADRIVVHVYARRYQGPTAHVLDILRTVDLRGLADYAKDLPSQKTTAPPPRSATCSADTSGACAAGCGGECRDDAQPRRCCHRHRRGRG